MAEWLRYPRLFRLREEGKNSTGEINIGIKEDENLDYENWDGFFYLTKYDNVITFEMHCSQEFPNKPPTIKITNDGGNKKLKSLCDGANLKPENLSWNKEQSICDNLKKVYNIINS